MCKNIMYMSQQYVSVPLLYIQYSLYRGNQSFLFCFVVCYFLLLLCLSFFTVVVTVSLRCVCSTYHVIQHHFPRGVFLNLVSSTSRNNVLIPGVVHGQLVPELYICNSSLTWTKLSRLFIDSVTSLFLSKRRGNLFKRLFFHHTKIKK